MSDLTHFEAFEVEHVTWLGLSAHEDGALMPSDAARIEAHLAGCATCRAVQNELRAVLEKVAATADDRVPEAPQGRRRAAVTAALAAFDEQHLEPLKEEKAGRALASARRSLGRIGVATLVAMAAIVGAVALHGGRPSAPSASSSDPASRHQAAVTGATGHAGAAVHIGTLLQTGTCPLNPTPSASRDAMVVREIWARPPGCALVGDDQLRVGQASVSKLFIGPGAKIVLHLTRSTTLPPIAVVLVNGRLVGRASSGGARIVIVTGLSGTGRRLVEHALGR